MSPLHVDPATGEVIERGEGDESQELAEAIERLRRQHAEAHQEARRIGEHLHEAEAAFLALVPVGEGRDTPSGAVVHVVASARRAVDKEACERRREELLGLGLGAMVYRHPGLKEIDAHAAALIRAGIQPATLAVPVGPVIRVTEPT